MFENFEIDTKKCLSQSTVAAQSDCQSLSIVTSKPEDLNRASSSASSWLLMVELVCTKTHCFSFSSSITSSSWVNKGVSVK